ncbi:MAG: cysteine desulfurase [Atopobiaceae bacterium]|nr:cysteine desulfurase [Atopobiaceae bacterium]
MGAWPYCLFADRGKNMVAAQDEHLVYLDHAAATPIAREVLEAMTPFFCESFYNPSSPYAPARAVRACLEDARGRLGHAIGSRGGNITLTAGATEANNLAFAAVDGHVVTDAIEHESVLACAALHDSSIVGVDATGRVDPESVRNALRPTTELVSIELANGEIGTVQPIRQIARIVADERMRRLQTGNQRPILLHTDASQAAGSVSVNVSTLGVDLMTLSAAKIYGPKQVGLLWHADGVALRPLVRGGGQEANIRSGTENVAGAVGFAVALELAEDLRASETRRLNCLSALLRKEISQRLGEAVFSGPARNKGRLPGLIHVSIPEADARRLVIGLERRGVLVGTGSACAASRMRISHVLRAIGLSDALAQGSLRLSMGRSTSEEDVCYAAECLEACVREQREFGAWKGGL